MMRLSTLILLGALAAPAIASAQTINTAAGRLDLAGTAPSACLVSAPGSVSGGNASFQVTGTQAAQIDITQLVDATTAQPRATSINLALPIICNGAHRLTVTTTNGGLARVGGNARNVSVTNGFREFLPYQVTASWAGQSTTGGSQTTTPVSMNVSDGAAGQLSLIIAVPAGGAPLVAGAYADSLVIRLQVAS